MANTLITPAWIAQEIMNAMTNHDIAPAVQALADEWDRRAAEIYGLDSRATLPTIPPMPYVAPACDCPACRYGALLAETLVLPPDPSDPAPFSPDWYDTIRIRLPQRFQVSHGLSYQPQPITDQHVTVSVTDQASVGFEWQTTHKGKGKRGPKAKR